MIVKKKKKKNVGNKFLSFFFWWKNSIKIIFSVFYSFFPLEAKMEINIGLAVKKIREEVNGSKRKEKIDVLEEMLIENFEKLLSFDEFFDLPLEIIYSTFSKFVFDTKERKEIFPILLDYIKNTINAHSIEAGTLSLLFCLDINKLGLSFEDQVSILELFNNCPFLRSFCDSINNDKILVEKNYPYDIKIKDSEIEELKQQIKELQSKLNQQRIPLSRDYEPDIFKACDDGKLTSVKLLIEKDHVLKNKKDKNNDTPIHHATKCGHIHIVQYLINNLNVDKDIKGFSDKTPLHLACENNHIQIVQYLLTKHASINSKDCNGLTPLHYAVLNCNVEIVNLLVSQGANTNIRDIYSRSPSDLTENDQIKDILKIKNEV